MAERIPITPPKWRSPVFRTGLIWNLIALQPHADPAAVAAHTWAKFLEGNAGTMCLGDARSILPAKDKPLKNGRKRPDGVQLEWETAQIGEGNGTFFPFLIHDFTSRDLRAYPSGKPTTAKFTGIVKVYIAVKNLEAAIGEYRRAYKLAEPERKDDAVFRRETGVGFQELRLSSPRRWENPG